MPLKIFLKKPNSISPVSGLMLFAGLPTTYCSGSSIPLSRKLLKICSFKAGLFSIKVSGTIISPVWMCATLSSPKRPWPAIFSATAVNCAKPCSPNSFLASSASRVEKSSSDIAKSPIPPVGTSSSSVLSCFFFAKFAINPIPQCFF